MESTSNMKVRLRFPPSPTGHWHLGGARTALFNWLYARKSGGVLVLRIEDTDRERSDQKYEIEIVETMKWLGLDWDEGPDWVRKGAELASVQKGDRGPYRQSERLPIYRKYLEQLIASGQAYYCYCTKEELEAQRQSFAADGLPPIYSGHCRALSAPPAGREPELIRFKTPQINVEFRDIIRGQVRFDTALFGDFVIARNLDSPLYNFAVVVDDELMGISHVVRGEDHISNTPKQILIQRALGFSEPVYGHFPLILASDRSKLSKRSAETSMLQYREDGYLPEAMLNFLALLGWHPSGDREIFSRAELVEAFDLGRVQKSGAVFNPEKLDWLNAQYIRAMSVEELAARLEPFLSRQIDPALLRKLILAERERMVTLKDFAELTAFIFELPEYEPGLLVWKKSSPEKTRTVLDSLTSLLAGLPADHLGDREKLTEDLAGLTETHGRGEVLWPLRVALSGQAASPDPMIILGMLAKEEAVRRLEIARAKMDKIKSP